MNIFDLIEPINLINQIKTDALSKQRNSLNVSITRKKPAYSFMASRMHSRPYNDSFINTAVTPQTRKNSNGPVNKSLASKTRIEIMIPDIDKLTTETERYKFVTTASRDVLAKIDPSMYFGIRVGPVYKPIDRQLIYDFDSNVIYKRELVDDETRIVYNENSPYMMIDKVNYRNIFIDTKNFVPILSYQLTRLTDIETYEDDIITEDLVPNGFYSEHPNADNIREEARMHEEEKQFNQEKQELQDLHTAIDSARRPVDEEEIDNDDDNANKLKELLKTPEIPKTLESDYVSPVKDDEQPVQHERKIYHIFDSIDEYNQAILDSKDNHPADCIFDFDPSDEYTVEELLYDFFPSYIARNALEYKKSRAEVVTRLLKVYNDCLIRKKSKPVDSLYAYACFLSQNRKDDYARIWGEQVSKKIQNNEISDMKITEYMKILI